MSKVTIHDVASAAGVSVSTVSNVMNGKGRVADETATAVRAVIAELGFAPRLNRRRRQNLANQHQEAQAVPVRQGQVLLLIPDPNPAAAHTYQLGRITAALAEALGEFEVDVVSASLPADGRLPYCLEQGQMQGVALRAGELTASQKEALQGMPCVEFFGVGFDAPGDQVVVDNEGIGRMAVDYLRERGCTRLVGLSPDRRHPSFHLRLQGFDFGARLGEIGAELVEFERGCSLREALPAAEEGLGVFVAGYDHFNEPEAMDGWLAEAGLTEANGVTVIGTAPDVLRHATISASPERVGRHCAEQLAWRIQSPHADRRRIMIEPRLVAGVEIRKQRISEEPARRLSS